MEVKASATRGPEQSFIKIRSELGGVSLEVLEAEARPTPVEPGLLPQGHLLSTPPRGRL
jgi:hypothetical protein